MDTLSYRHPSEDGETGRGSRNRKTVDGQLSVTSLPRVGWGWGRSRCGQRWHFNSARRHRLQPDGRGVWAAGQGPWGTDRLAGSEREPAGRPKPRPRSPPPSSHHQCVRGPGLTWWQRDAPGTSRTAVYLSSFSCGPLPALTCSKTEQLPRLEGFVLLKEQLVRC